MTYSVQCLYFGHMAANVLPVYESANAPQRKPCCYTIGIVPVHSLQVEPVFRSISQEVFPYALERNVRELYFCQSCPRPLTFNLVPNSRPAIIEELGCLGIERRTTVR